MFRVRFNSFRQKWAVQSKSLENTTGVKRPHRYRRWTVISKPIAKSQTHRCQGTSPRYFVRSVATSTDLLIPKLSFQRPRNRPKTDLHFQCPAVIGGPSRGQRGLFVPRQSLWKQLFRHPRPFSRPQKLSRKRDDTSWPRTFVSCYFILFILPWKIYSFIG